MIEHAIAAAVGKRRKTPTLHTCLIECANDEDSGSIGAAYIEKWAVEAGVSVERLSRKSNRYGYDVELVSVHHCLDIPRLAAMPKRGKLRIVGGHVTLSNVRPTIPFADVVCVGEGESWIRSAIGLLTRDCRAESLAHLPGTIISSRMEPGALLPTANVENPLPDNRPYLNRPGTLSARWYIEIARGCPHRCAYCELGHSMPYRRYRFDHLMMKLSDVDGSITRKVNWFAPDEASHPDYRELMAELDRRNYRQAFGSYRLDELLRYRDLVPPDQLVRFGLDGLTQSTRKRVRKPITDSQIRRFFKVFRAMGHDKFKMFMMFGYPWESVADFQEWSETMSHVLSEPGHECELRIKWTPLIPQPTTPLRNARTDYRADIARCIREWHRIAEWKWRRNGWAVVCDGIVGEALHRKQVELTCGDETVCLDGATGYVNKEWSA